MIITNCEEARKVLKDANDACRLANDKMVEMKRIFGPNDDLPGSVAGMSHGAFSGVNDVLGFISTLQSENRFLRETLEKTDSQL